MKIDPGSRLSMSSPMSDRIFENIEAVVLWTGVR
jgi:hypothetical protein